MWLHPLVSQPFKHASPACLYLSASAFGWSTYGVSRGDAASRRIEQQRLGLYYADYSERPSTGLHKLQVCVCFQNIADSTQCLIYSLVNRIVDGSRIVVVIMSRKPDSDKRALSCIDYAAFYQFIILSAAGEASILSTAFKAGLEARLLSPSSSMPLSQQSPSPTQPGHGQRTQSAGAPLL